MRQAALGVRYLGRDFGGGAEISTRGACAPRSGEFDASRRKIAHAFGDQSNMVRRRAAAAAHDVEPAIARPGIELRRECLWCLGKSGRRKRIRQAGGRIGADEPVGAMSKLFDVRL